MSRLFALILLCTFIGHFSNGQALITSGDAKFFSKGEVAVSLNDMDLVNNGNFDMEEGQLSMNNSYYLAKIEGQNIPTFNNFTLNVSGFLETSVDFKVLTDLNLKKGEIDLQNNDLILPLNKSKIVGETSDNRILSSGDGEIIKYSFNEQLKETSVGNLGIVFADFNNEDSLVIRRGHRTLPIPFGESITRYYKISTFKKPTDKLEIGLEYFDDEVVAVDPELEEQIWVMNDGEWNRAQANIKRKPNGSGNYIKGELEIFETIVTVGLYRRLISKSEIPNVFTPNSDGINDTFMIPGIEKLPNAEVKVYNIYGQLLYASSQYLRNPWDGTYKGQTQPMGTYYYQISDAKNPLEFIEGELSIIK